MWVNLLHEYLSTLYLIILITYIYTHHVIYIYIYIYALFYDINLIYYNMYVHIYIYDLKRHILYIQQLKCHSAWAQAGPPDGSHLGRGKVGDDVTRHGPLSSPTERGCHRTQSKGKEHLGLLFPI